MNLFKRKIVNNQERGINLTLEQLKQSTDIRFEELYNYLDKVANNMLDEGGTIQGSLNIEGNVYNKGNLNIEGEITKNGEEIALLKDCKKFNYFNHLDDSVLDDIPTLLGEDYQSGKPYYIELNPLTSNSLFKGLTFIVEGVLFNGGYGSQIAYSYDQPNVIKKRSCWTGTWTEWTNVSPKHIATYSLNNRLNITTTAWALETIPLDNFYTNIPTFGDLFSKSNYGIKVNRNAKLLISANLSLISTSANTNELTFAIVGNTQGHIADIFGNDGSGLLSYCASPVLKSVSAGEIISLAVSGGNAYNYTILEKGTYLTIQEV